MHSYPAHRKLKLSLSRKISSFFPFSMRKMHRTKQPKKEPYRKSEKFSSLPRIPFVAQTHPKSFRGESELCLKNFSPQRGYSRFSSQPKRKHPRVSIFLSSLTKESEKLFSPSTLLQSYQTGGSKVVIQQK